MIPLSVRADRPVDPVTVAVLRAIDGRAKALGFAYFVAGAMARDIVLTNVFGIGTQRATRDVDFAVTVKNWGEFSTIKDQLVATGLFDVSAKVHRLQYKSSSGSGGYPVDLLPFGGVEDASHRIAWPPDMKVGMNVVGYAEALASALAIAVEPGLVIPVTSLPGLALLKLFAWRDRHHETAKDAQDLVILCRGYQDAGNQDRLYGEEIGMLEALGFDLDLASPHLLGKDARAIAQPETLHQATALLGDARLVDHLVTQMAIELKGADDSVTAAQRLLEQFQAGLTGQPVAGQAAH